MRMLKKEKIIVMLAMSSFVIFCVFGFVYLPELKAGTQFAYKQIKDAGPDLIGLIPPVEQLPEPNANIESPLAKYPVQVTARAKLVDMARLQNKIKEEMNVVNRSQGEAVLPQPFSFNSNGQIEHGGVDSSSKRNFDDDWQPAELPSGEAKDSETKHRRDVVRDMMKHAWKNYVDFAWGENELRPISKRGHSPGIFGRSKLGASIVDAMDTLFIMGLKDEFKMGRDWIADNLSIENMHTDISVFEFTIRFIAGLLTCYSLTKDSMFLEKANSMADSLLPAFNSPKGIPYALINPKTGFAKNYVWAASGCSILSEIGTLHLEMVYLSDMVKNPIYKDKVMKVRNLLQSANKPNGLYPNYVNPKTGAWCQHHISVGALGDSFYEYLLKAWIQSGGRDMDARKMYDEALDSIEHHLLQTSATNKLLYFAEMKYERLEHKMDHLACFIGGLIGLGAQSLDQPSKKHYT
ncbi:Mannosyl-oligosaccharide alpha-1,2-mannosidase IA [Halotydeus destructor]|nr:Mannosyl-oligosaccharide alpha-1,2-mannosidase IA [Halotydeus destructor]